MTRVFIVGEVKKGEQEINSIIRVMHCEERAEEVRAGWESFLEGRVDDVEVVVQIWAVL